MALNISRVSNVAFPVAQRRGVSSLHHGSHGTHCLGRLPGDEARESCFMTWGVNLVTVTFQPSRGWAPKIPHPENGVTVESVSSPLALCPGVVSMRHRSQQPTLSCRVSWGLRAWRQAGPQRWPCSWHTETCSLEASSFSVLWPQPWERLWLPTCGLKTDFPDDALGKRPQAELCVSDPSWLHILDLKER